MDNTKDCKTRSRKDAATTHKRIVVGVDGSPESLNAVDFAAARARLDGSEIELVCAYALPSYSADSGLSSEETLRAGAQRVVDDAADHIAGKHQLQVTRTVLPGNPTGILRRKSESSQLIVLGSRGGGGFADRLLGAIPAALPGYSSCPVVIVPGETAGKRHEVHRIAVGTDGSRPATSSLSQAITEAELWGAHLDVIRAMPLTRSMAAIPWMTVSGDTPAIIQAATEETEQAIAESIATAGIQAEVQVLDGDPADTLLDYAKSVDMLVVGTHGRGGVRGVLLGSTSQVVLQESPVPVMVVPSSR